MCTVVLSGGVGGARFLTGLYHNMPPFSVTVISNIGDDSDFWGLRVCPDIDIILYTLAGLVDDQTGWGLEGDTSNVLSQLKIFGCEDWFHLGDKDFATQIFRTFMLRQGAQLSKITEHLTRSLGLHLTILPVSDQPVSTVIYTDHEQLPFQEYMVKYRYQKKVRKIHFTGSEVASPSPGVLEAIDTADQIIVAPSNPYVSIGAILSVPGLREHLQNTKAPVAAISPIVGGNAIKGPAAKMLAEFGCPVTPVSVAKLYADFIDLFVIDKRDVIYLPCIESMGIRAIATQTIMSSFTDKVNLAKTVIAELEKWKKGGE